MLPAALSIAGSDPSGGAGIQADLKTFHRFGVYGEAVITLLTVQNTQRVSRVVCMDPALVVEQVRAVIEDIPPAAAKFGALGNPRIVEVLADEMERWRFPVVIDPVMISKHGAPLLGEEGCRTVRDLLVPRAYLITPNIPEALALTGEKDGRSAAVALRKAGARNALIKGGHLEGDATDILLTESGEFYEFTAARIDTPHTHLFNCEDRLRSDPNGTIRRLAGLLGVDEERVRLWTFARAAAEPRTAWANDWAFDLARAIAPS